MYLIIYYVLIWRVMIFSLIILVSTTHIKRSTLVNDLTKYPSSWMTFFKFKCSFDSQRLKILKFTDICRASSKFRGRFNTFSKFKRQNDINWEGKIGNQVNCVLKIKIKKKKHYSKETHKEIWALWNVRTEQNVDKKLTVLTVSYITKNK